MGQPKKGVMNMTEENVVEPQDSTNDVQVDLTKLEGLKLGDAELEQLKSNENLLSALTHMVDQKRSANAEAKKYRELIEQKEAEEAQRKEEELKQKGEFESLYQDAQQKLTNKDNAIKQALIKGELSRLAGMHGLAKADYLKLLDTTNIEVDVDNLSVSGASEVFSQFKEENPSLFIQKENNPTPNTDASQPKNSESTDDRVKNYQALKNKENKSREDVARLYVLKRELSSAGLI